MTVEATDTSAFISADHPEQLRDAVRRAVDYRGDVTVRLRDGREITGFAFDARVHDAGGGAIDPSEELRILGAESNDRLRLPLVEIGALGFTGKDAASGKTWENWVRRYAEKKLAGEAASIEAETL